MEGSSVDARTVVTDRSTRARSDAATAGPDVEEAVADACDGDEPRPTLPAGATVRTAAYVGTLWGSTVGLLTGVIVLLVPWLDARADGTLGMLARGIAVGGAAGALIGALVDLDNWMADRMIGRRAPHRPPRR
jgi:hypothetical protein